MPSARAISATPLARGSEPLELASSGGEDYELLAALPAERLAEATSGIAAREATTLGQIGTVVAGEGVEIRLPGGAKLDARGFDQLGR